MKKVSHRSNTFKELNFFGLSFKTSTFCLLVNDSKPVLRKLYVALFKSNGSKRVEKENIAVEQFAGLIISRKSD